MLEHLRFHSNGFPLLCNVLILFFCTTAKVYIGDALPKVFKIYFLAILRHEGFLPAKIMIVIYIIETEVVYSLVVCYGS